MGSEQRRSYKRFNMVHRLENGWLNPETVLVVPDDASTRSLQVRSGIGAHFHPGPLLSLLLLLLLLLLLPLP